MDRCTCNEVIVLRDAEAERHVEHLVDEAAAPGAEATYRCPYTMHRWNGQRVQAAEGERYELRRVTEGERESSPQTPDA